MAAKKIFRPDDADKVEFKATRALCPRCYVMQPVYEDGKAATVRLARHPHVEFVGGLRVEHGACKGSAVLVVHPMAAEIMRAVAREKRAA